MKWPTPADNIYSPVFSSVTFNASAPTAVTSEDGKVTFTGSYDPISLAAGDKSVLYLGAANTLYYPSATMTVGSCRAYFMLNEDSAEVENYVMNFGEGEDETLL